MGAMTKEEINVGLFDEVKRLKKELSNKESQLKSEMKLNNSLNEQLNEFVKEFDSDSIHRFLNAIRKSDMEININVEARSISYQFSNQKPFNAENWKITLNAMIRDMTITSNEANTLNKMMENLLKHN